MGAGLWCPTGVKEDALMNLCFPGVYFGEDRTEANIPLMKAHTHRHRTPEVWRQTALGRQMESRKVL